VCLVVRLFLEAGQAGSAVVGVTMRIMGLDDE
jgi:hypothetical protein